MTSASVSLPSEHLACYRAFVPRGRAVCTPSLCAPSTTPAFLSASCRQRPYLHLCGLPCDTLWLKEKHLSSLTWKTACSDGKGDPTFSPEYTVGVLHRASQHRACGPGEFSPPCKELAPYKPGTRSGMLESVA